MRRQLFYILAGVGLVWRQEGWYVDRLNGELLTKATWLCEKIRAALPTGRLDVDVLDKQACEVQMVSRGVANLGMLELTMREGVVVVSMTADTNWQ